MTYEFYKTLHFMSLIILFFSFGVIFLGMIFKDQLSKGHRLLGFIGHGVGLFFLLLSGFGMAARLQIFGDWPAWMTTKLGIWVVLGILAAMLKRMPKHRNQLLIVIIALGFSAVYLAVNKPI